MPLANNMLIVTFWCRDWCPLAAASKKHTFMSTCGQAHTNFVFGALKNCDDILYVWEKVSHIWAITNHKSQIYDCESQTQLRYGNAPIFTSLQFDVECIINNNMPLALSSLEEQVVKYFQDDLIQLLVMSMISFHVLFLDATIIFQGVRVKVKDKIFHPEHWSFWYLPRNSIVVHDQELHLLLYIITKVLQWNVVLKMETNQCISYIISTIIWDLKNNF